MSVHVPVLLRECLEWLTPPFEHAFSSSQTDEAWFVDLTFGGGGHTGAFLDFFEQKNLKQARILACDQDLAAIERGKKKFEKDILSGRLVLVHGPFSAISTYLNQHPSKEPAKEPAKKPVLGMLADLGFSSDQLEDPARGLSFHAAGPLDMRLSQSESIPTCFERLMEVDVDELERVIRELGEERFSRRIAQSIIDARHQGALTDDTQTLSRLIIRGIPAKFRHGRIHASTRTFQALRIWVNSELEELDLLLDNVILSLSPLGRLGVISFHSGEDRRVKRAFKKWSQEDFELLTPKPVSASETECDTNPRSRSAKLRVIECRRGLTEASFISGSRSG